MGRWGAIGRDRRRQYVRNRKQRAPPPPQKQRKKLHVHIRARALSLDRGSEGILRARGAALESLQPHRTSAPDLFTVNTLLTPP